MRQFQRNKLERFNQTARKINYRLPWCSNSEKTAAQDYFPNTTKKRHPKANT
jgi:hypothetical protein